MEEVKPEEPVNISLEEDNEPEESVYSDPNAAVIVSFLEQFGKEIFNDNTPIMSDVMDWISNTDKISTELQDIHVKLLRRLKRSVRPEKWEKAIIKLLASIGLNDDAFEVERYGYLHSDFRIKLRILKNLLEMQFDVNSKFKNTVNAKNSNELRLEPFGRDKDGNIYYCHMDDKANIKVYQENTDEETWSVVANNRDELVKLIDELKGHKQIRPFPKDLIDEDSSSNSVIKEEVIVEQKPTEQQEYSIDNSSANDEFPLKQTIRLVKKNENAVKEESSVEQSNAESEKDSDSPEKATVQKKKRRK